MSAGLSREILRSHLIEIPPSPAEERKKVERSARHRVVGVSSTPRTQSRPPAPLAIYTEKHVEKSQGHACQQEAQTAGVQGGTAKKPTGKKQQQLRTQKEKILTHCTVAAVVAVAVG
ncbi:hypothetical protein PG988_007031 [Apiospora saccharicola]